MKKINYISPNIKSILKVAALFLSLILATNSYSQENIDSVLNIGYDKDYSQADRIDAFSRAYEITHSLGDYVKEEKSLKGLIEVYEELPYEEEIFRNKLRLQYLYANTFQYEKLAKINFDLAKIAFDQKLYDLAENYLIESEIQFEYFDNVKLKQQCLIYHAEINSINKEHLSSIANYKSALNYSKEIHDVESITEIYQKIGLEFQKSEKYDEGIEYYYELLGQLSLNSNTAERGIIHNNLAVMQSKKGNTQLAEHHFKKAIEFIPEEKSYLNILSKANINLAIISQKQSKQSKALDYAMDARKIALDANNISLLGEINYITANLYYFIADYYNALIYADEAIDNSRRSRKPDLEIETLLFKTKIYEALENYESARDVMAEYYQEENAYKNFLQSEETLTNTKRISFEKIEKEVILEQKTSAERIAESERIKAEEEARKSRESQILRDKALAQAQSEIAKSKLIEAEKNQALSKAKQDSLLAANALAQEENALQKAKADSLTAVSALQKQKIAENEVLNAEKENKRTQIIAFLLIIILIIIVLGLFRQQELNKQLAKEKEKTDALLLNILPASVADELKSKNMVAPRKFEKVSVLFTDFVGFTSIAEELSEDELIEELDKYFNVFDKIIERHNLEKIKTIGDSYMCAGGVPVENNTSAFDAVKAGLEIAEFVAADVEKKKIQRKSYWDIRIGINTGPVIAGIVGSKKFAYDIWGDTVNTASRIESNGLIGKVNISSSTQKEVADKFECISRGRINLKNKGEVEIFYINN